MQFKKYIILVFISGVFCQSLFNRVLPEAYYLGDAQSMGSGHTYLTNSSTSKLILSNPAKISRINSVFDIHFNLLSTSERRTRIIKDNWGDFLTETDYVFNQNNYFSSSSGFIFSNKNKNTKKINFGVGWHYTPLYSLNYDYEEEVRADADLEDGIIGIDDAIIGYHTYSTKGDLVLHSIGFSISNNDLFGYALGFSINQVQSSKIKDKLYISLIDPGYYANNNIAIANSFQNEYKINGDYEEDYYFVFSIEFINKHIELSLSYEQDLIIRTNEQPNLVNFSYYTGLPLFFEMNSNNELEYLISGLNFNKPKRFNFGLLYNPKNKSNLSIAFEVLGQKWNIPFFAFDNNDFNHFKSSLLEYRFGFEYLPFKSFPIRAGLVYSESFLTDPKTILTLGTGKKIGKFVELDLAVDYSTFKHYYYDLFPENDIFNLSCDLIQCDKVKENRLNFLTTIKVNF